MTAWIVTAVSVAAVIVIGLIATIRKNSADKQMQARHRFIEIGRERDEVWVPGDPRINEDDDFEDFDEL